ncbi:Uu.00g071710.m01.CDS01 [Anthostomella pinea]|uniref:Uu.00g071710.m01.CDS01 n=1 Tax=Anthostomella pinea TaxID=933095 RepID=A0AAI8VPA8_9PEZI|nr:Uu.00g071710.m01.CDS01 [Anthostomella pinea]
MELDPQSLIAQLEVGANTRDQLAALRYLKNEVVGHLQKKEQWVQHGVVAPLVNIIASDAPGSEGEGLQQPFLSLGAFTDEDTAKLHALQLLASFANAGPAFLPPLLAIGAIPAIMSTSCLRNEHSQIVLAALRVLRDVTAAIPFIAPPSPMISSSLADTIFTNGHLELFSQILAPPASSPDSEAQVSIVAYLIRSLCRGEHQSALVGSGILDALATRLASFAVAEGQVLPGAEILAAAEDLYDYIPEPATPAGSLEEVLGAIAVIITDSPFRTCKLLFSPSILAIFPNVNVDLGKYSRTPPESLELPGLRPIRQREIEFMDLLLPYVPSQLRGQTGHAFPPLGTSTPKENSNLYGRPSSKLQTSIVSWSPPEESFAASDNDSGNAESPMLPWLINLVRTRSGGEVLAAASVLTSLFKAGFAYKTREPSLGLLVVPVLLTLLNDVEAKMKDVDISNRNHDTASSLRIIEETPALLARLITDSEPLQKAAFDCGAVKVISKLLKGSYDAPLPTTQARPWSPRVKDASTRGNIPAECQLGEEGPHQQLVHRIKVRENSLMALGALATFTEEYRKAIIDQDTISYIVDSLDPSSRASKLYVDQARSDSTKKVPLDWNINPVSVVEAACYTIRMLSRSVNILRTALVDHGVAIPIFQLLRHPEIDVQIAATASICNLVTDFSPMREPLVRAGVLKALCEHAHSQVSSLRLNALWALKHLVDFASIELKKRCVEELQSGWLVQLICDDTEDEALFAAKAKTDRQAAQGILDDMDEDMDMGPVDNYSRPWLSTSFYKPPSAGQAQSDIRILQLAETRLSVLQEAELNPIRKARQDDLLIQEQGLGLIRNLIGGAHSSNSAESANDTTEMIDFLFNTLGQDRLFDILGSKMRVKVLHPYSRRSATGSETRVLPPQAKIIEAVIYILVHIAASIPRHRQLVIAQTELLQQLAKLFSSQDREVRVALCHLINNLTWQDDGSDQHACSQRASELRKLGFLAKLETLGQSDDELDVRERAKSALWQMKSGY